MLKPFIIPFVILFLLFSFCLPGFVSKAEATTVDFIKLDIGRADFTGPVTAIVQDHRGYLWFAGPEAIKRYDGYQVKTYRLWRRDDKNIYAFTSLLVGRNGDIWAASEQGLSRYDKVRDIFSPVDLHPQDKLLTLSINAMLEDESGVLWLGTNHGLVQYDPVTGRFRTFNFPSNDSQTSAIWSMYISQSGVLWIGHNHGLYKFDRQTERVLLVMHERPILAINEDNQGRLWIGRDKGVKRFVLNQSGELENDLEALNFTSVTAIWRDNAGYLWFGSLNGLYRADPKTSALEPFLMKGNTPDVVLRRPILSIYQDDTGLLWTGASAGIWHSRSGLLPLKRYQSVVEDQGSRFPLSISALHIVDDKVWVGTRGAGLSYFDADMGNYAQRSWFINNEQLSGTQVSALESDDRGFLWAGTTDGLNQINLANDQVSQFVHHADIDNSLAANEVLALFSSKSGELWIGTEKGLSRFNYHDGTFDNFFYQAHSPGNSGHRRVVAITEDYSGDLWLGSSHGIIRFDIKTGQFEQFHIDQNDKNWFGVNVIVSAYFDEKLGLWFGTNGGGLAHFDKTTKRFRRYQEGDGISGQTVVGITSANGYIWLATSKGIDRFDPATQSFAGFSVDRLRQGSRFTPRTLVSKDNGILYFGGADFLYEVDSARLAGPVNVPELSIVKATVEQQGSTEIIHFNSEDSEGKPQIRLPYQQQSFTLHFALFDYTSPEQNRYMYKLSGYDKQWQTAALGVREVSYHSLAPGHYQFHLKARSPSGSWWDNEQVYDIAIEYPPGRSWWAYCIYLAVFIVLAKVIVHWQKRGLFEKEALAQTAETPEEVPAEPERQPLSEKDQMFVAKLDEVIARHYSDPSFNVIKLSDLLALSERQLRRKLKALCDCSPIEYLRRYRLEAARKQLLTGERVNVVADAVGFSSATYMSNCFKNQYGVSPGQYQKANR